jgi:hypothetical protein
MPSQILPSLNNPLNGGGGVPSTASGPGGNKVFMTPWLDYSTVAVPDNHAMVMWWAQYLWLSDGNFRTSMERVASHFMTHIKLPDLEDDEESAWNDFFQTHFNYRKELIGCAYDYLCFHGDVQAVTKDGVFKLRDLAGQTVDVLSQGGVYRKAEFKSFGRQELLEVTFSDGRTVLATPEHEWVVQKSTGGTVRVPTTALEGRKIERTVAPRPVQGDEFKEGVRHGFVFGDGSLYNKHTRAVANFYGAKDEEMIPFFEGHGCAPIVCDEVKRLTKVHGLPPHYKQLPDPQASAEYWYGFVCGFLAADGSVDTYGCTVLTQTTKATLEAIEKQLPRIGMAAGPLRSQRRIADLSQVNGDPDAIYDTEMHYLTLLKNFMLPQDILLSSHSAKFEANRKETNYGKFIHVASVKPTGVFDEVFCCVEPETHTFVIEQGILTGNCYGNNFISLYLPFKRFTICQGCGLEQPLSEIDYSIRFSSNAPFVTWNRVKACPRCQNNLPYKVIDRRDPDLSRVRLNRYDPSDIEISQNRFSLRKEFFWRIPDEVRRDIQSGARIHIDDTPLEVLDAVAQNGRLCFDDDMLLHQEELTVSGVRTYGWGLPRSISNFRTAWLQQLTNKLDQAVVMDYTLGRRVVSPAPTPGQTDPMQTMNMERFVSRVGAMFQDSRNNPVGIYTSPYPLNYQFLGGEGDKLLPAEKLKFRQQEYLNQLGVPLEYHQMTLSVQAAPMALRLFEAYWQNIPSFYNRTLQWIVDILSPLYGLKGTKVEMMKTTLADDMDRKQVLLQLMSANQLSPETALEPFGVDPRKEAKQVISHEEYVAKLQDKAAEKEAKRQEMGILKSQASNPTPSSMQAQQDAAAGGAPPPGTPMGGMPMGGTPGAGASPAQPRTLEEMEQQSEEIAQQLLVMDDYSRKQELKALREGNKALHGLVKQKLEEMRRQTNSQGGQMLREQGAQQAGV